MSVARIIPARPAALALLAGLLTVGADAQTTEPGTPDTDQNRRIERLGDTTVDEWQMDLRLPKPVADTPAGEIPDTLPDPGQDRQFHQLIARLARDPKNPSVLQQLDTLLTDVLRQAENHLDAGSPEQAQPLLLLVQSIDPGIEGLKRALGRLADMQASRGLVRAGQDALREGRVVEPAANSALHFFHEAAARDPANSAAQAGLADVQERLLQRALAAAAKQDFKTADAWLGQAGAIDAAAPRLERARRKLTALHQQYFLDLETRAVEAMDSGNFDQAEKDISSLAASGGRGPRVDALRKRLEEARSYGGLEPGQTITDRFLQGDGSAPETVVIAAGSYFMGSPAGVEGSRDNERPRHRVSIARGVAIGRREVTVGEFRLFIGRSGYRTAAELAGSSTVYEEASGQLVRRDGVDWEDDYAGQRAAADMPVLHVNWFDARAYVEWLSRETGKHYRLPSEAEYEYVARAGSAGNFWWGDGAPPEEVGNLTGERDRSPSARQWTDFFSRYGDGYWGPAPVGSFKPNPMGVYDIAGNVSEWTEDCWHPSYAQAPADGAPWVSPACERRVARGGYWASPPLNSRASFRISARARTYGPVVGIRVARDL